MQANGASALAQQAEEAARGGDQAGVVAALDLFEPMMDRLIPALDRAAEPAGDGDGAG